MTHFILGQLLATGIASFVYHVTGNIALACWVGGSIIWWCLALGYFI